MDFVEGGFYFKEDFIPYQAICLISKINCDDHETHAYFSMKISLVNGKEIEIYEHTRFKSDKNEAKKETENLKKEMDLIRKNLIDNFNKWNEKKK